MAKEAFGKATGFRVLGLGFRGQQRLAAEPGWSLQELSMRHELYKDSAWGCLGGPLEAIAEVSTKSFLHQSMGSIKAS